MRLTPATAVAAAHRRALAEARDLAGAGETSRALARLDAVLRHLPAGVARAEALVQRFYVEADDYASGDLTLAQALAECATIPALRGRVLDLLGWLRGMFKGDLPAGIACTREAVELAAQASDDELVALSTARLAHMRALAQEGCAIGICARTAKDVDRTIQELQDQGVRAAGTAVDVLAPGGVERFIDEAAAALGGVDLLVANVGATAGGTLMESTPADWAATFELNVLHAVRALSACVPHMTERGGGSAVFVSSITGHKPAPRRSTAPPRPPRSTPPPPWPANPPPTSSASTPSAPARSASPGGWDTLATRDPTPTPPSSTATSPPAASAPPKRSPTPSPSCCHPAPAGSTAPTSASTAPNTAPAPPPGSATPPHWRRRRGRTAARVS